MKLRNNKWGFDLNLDNPFRIFPYLRELAAEAVGEDNMLDLSRGEPGYAFAPSLRGRRLYAFFLELDALFNNPDRRFAYEQHKNSAEIFNEIETFAKKRYADPSDVLADFKEFVERCARCSNMGKDKVLFELFKYATFSGGSYLKPAGEPIVRAVIADHYKKILKTDLSFEDIVLVNGVSHGIGTIFKVLCDSKIGFLRQGDFVMLQSPSYAPYNAIIQNRGLGIYPLHTDPETGEIDNLDETLKNAPRNTKLLVLINPNNPTGFSLTAEILRKLSGFAKKRDILIVTDDVYLEFFPEKFLSMMNYAPERTIMLSGRSKIERSTGLRFGEFVVAREGQKYIAEHILNLDSDLMTFLSSAKGPTGIGAEFQHTTFVPGPSQFLGIAHIILGKEDREEYLRRITRMTEFFYKILGLPYHENLYYATFDFMAFKNAKRIAEPEQFFVDLAKKGVCLLPANLFFAEEMRARKDCRTFARASLPNATPDGIAKAGKIIKDYIESSS